MRCRSHTLWRYRRHCLHHVARLFWHLCTKNHGCRSSTQHVTSPCRWTGRTYPFRRVGGRVFDYCDSCGTPVPRSNTQTRGSRLASVLGMHKCRHSQDSRIKNAGGRRSTIGPAAKRSGITHKARIVIKVKSGSRNQMLKQLI